MDEELKIEKRETHYDAIKLSQSEYDYFRIVQALDGRITIKWNDVRWRSVKETQSLLREMADKLELLNN